MATCACCGQQMASRMSNEVVAEEALLDCCQQAAALAHADGAAHIEIVHLAMALLHTRTGRDAFQRRLVDIVSLAEAVAGEMERTVHGGSNRAPDASQDFLHVLQCAEQAAADGNQETVTLSYVVDALLDRAQELDGGAFLRHILQTCEDREPRDERIEDDKAVQHDAVNRPPNQKRNRARHGSSKRRCGSDAYEAGRRDQMSTHAAAKSRDGDPFQLRVDNQTNESFLTTKRTARLSRRTSGRDRCTQEPPPDSLIATETTNPSLRAFDRQLREMQQQLTTIAEQIHLLTAQYDRSRRNTASAGPHERGGRQAASNTTQSQLRGPTDRDWARIARLLERLDASAQPLAGQEDEGGRSMHHRQRRRKSRIRASRQDWRRRLIDRFERSRRNRSDAPWKTNDAQRRPDQRPPRASSPLELDEHGFEDEDGDETDGKRFYLHIDDEIVRAPSIGPRTAERLTPHGIEQVSDLLAADAADLAERINARHITTQRIEDWQMQARLVCTVPWLRGTHAQLLVGAGYTTPGDICSVSGDKLSADILKFASTRDGQRVLRAGPPPEMEKILRWAENAAAAELDRAA